LEPRVILNVQNIHSVFFYQILYFANRKLILTAHHHGEWSPYFRIKWFKGIRKIYSYLLLFFENLVINRTDFFFIIDKKQLSYLAKNVRNLNHKVSLSNSGCDFEKFNNIDKNDAKQSLGLSLHKKYLFYVGQYYEYKEVDRLCVIYLKLKKVCPDVELMVAGGTSKDKYYKNLIECGAIDFGRILNTELYKYYSAASAYITMTFREDWFGGIGIAMIESLACGTPVISKCLYNLPNPDEINLVGRMPENEDEMIENISYVLNHPDEFNKCREVAKKYYDYKILQKQMRDVYEKFTINEET
ncbi:MAG: glycosyltransferase family 4 protein, partial [Ignavibacteria bacterium]